MRLKSDFQTNTEILDKIRVGLKKIWENKAPTTAVFFKKNGLRVEFIPNTDNVTLNVFDESAIFTGVCLESDTEFKHTLQLTISKKENGSKKFEFPDSPALLRDILLRLEDALNQPLTLHKINSYTLNGVDPNKQEMYDTRTFYSGRDYF